MVGQLARRSGIAAFEVLERLGWRPDFIYQVGVGNHHGEVEHMTKEWPLCKFIGMEPHPGIYKGIKDAYPGFLYNYAISDYNGTRAFYAKKHHADGSSLHYPDRMEGEWNDLEKYDVTVMTLDGMFCTELISKGARLLLWLDCEGSELAALKGGERFLKRVDVVNVEMTPSPPGSAWPKPHEVHRHLADRGFWLQWLHTQRISAGQSDGIYVKRSLYNPDLCCVPHEVIRWQDQDECMR